MKDPLTDYTDHVVAALQGRDLEGLQVVIDCANGAAFRSAPRVLKRLGAEVEVINAAPDGTNINQGCGSTDPTMLREAVLDLGARVGLAFDGDGDRVIAVDERGGIVDGDLVSLESRSGDIALKAKVSERMQPGVVYTTFHHAKTGANVITTDYSDWATNCPEYKVTAVQVRRTNRPSDWQAKFYEEDFSLTRIAQTLDAAE